MTGPSVIRLFAGLHREFLKRVIILDLLFFVASVWYLVAPIPPEIDAVRAAVLVLLIVLLFVSAHVRLLTEHTGRACYYRMLPVNTKPIILSARVILLLPFAAALTASAAIAASTPLHGSTALTVAARAAQVFAVFATIKLYAAPTFLLLRRSPLMVGALFMLLIPTIFVVSIVHEMVWTNSAVAPVWDVLAYVGILGLIESGVLRLRIP